MDKCLYKLTGTKLPYNRAEYKSECGFLYVRMDGPDNKPIEGDLCMKCHKPVTLIQVDKIRELEDRLQIYKISNRKKDEGIKKLSDALTTIEHMCFSSKKWPEHMHQAVLRDISTTAIEARNKY